MIPYIHFNMTYPRQILYNVNHIGFCKSFILAPLKKYLLNYRSRASQLASEFQSQFTQLTNLSKPLPLSRGRMGLYLFLKSLKGDRGEVLMSPFTIFDVINMVLIANKKPVFVDSAGPSTPHLSLSEIKRLKTNSTIAVLITHYHTPNEEIEAIADYCRQNNIALIEDCAISLGSRISGKHVGSFGDASFFSFGLFKFVSVYFGGCLVLNNPAHSAYSSISTQLLASRPMPLKAMLSYAWKGIKMSILTSPFLFPFVFRLYRSGFKFKIKVITEMAKNDPSPGVLKSLPRSYEYSANDFQLIEYSRQLPRTGFTLSHRQTIYNLYLKLLSSIAAYNKYQPSSQPSCINFPFVANSIDEKYQLISCLMDKGFDVGEYFYRSCNLIPEFAEFRSECPNLEHYSACVVTLPTHTRITFSYAESLAHCILNFYQL